MNLILDENIIELAARIPNRTGALCGTLIGVVLERCDTLFCDSKLFKSYLRRLELLKNSYGSGSVVRLLKFIQTKDCVKFNENAPKLLNEKLLPPDDVFLIRLAAHTRSILISTDDRLKNALKSSGLDSMYGIVFKSPEDLLKEYKLV